MCGNGTAVESPANNPVYSTSWNPFAATIAVFYDVTYCDGAGMRVDKEGGGKTAQYSDVVLYHELSHAFHFLTATQPPLDPDVSASLVQEEINAETDENDMRDVRGVPHREVTSHWGDCGLVDGGAEGDTGCCIVATLATGSAFSDEVNRFRHLREHTLRDSVVGADFFKEFFHRYYGFSPEVTLLMGRRPNLAPLVRSKFVLPLLAGVELLIHYADNEGAGLANCLRNQANRPDLAHIFTREFLGEISGYLEIARDFDAGAITKALKGKDETYKGFKELLRYIGKETVSDEYIEWSLLKVIGIWIESAQLLNSEKTEPEIDFEIYEKIVQWIALMPVSGVWSDFSRIETENELIGLERFIFDPRSKKAFARRLIEQHPTYGQTIGLWAAGKRR
jgi:hypothetical protein